MSSQSVIDAAQELSTFPSCYPMCLTRFVPLIVVLHVRGVKVASDGTTAVVDDTATTIIDAATDSTATTTTVTTGVPTGFQTMVAALEGDITAGTKTTVSMVGRLKMLDKALKTLDFSPTAQSLQLLTDLCELALLVLPENTRKVLEANGSGSDAALELVRRNLIQLPTLAKTLYTSTAEERAADAGLKALHDELGFALNLYGAFVAKGKPCR